MIFADKVLPLQFEQVESIDMTHCVSYPFTRLKSLSVLLVSWGVHVQGKQLFHSFLPLLLIVINS